MAELDKKSVIEDLQQRLASMQESTMTAEQVRGLFDSYVQEMKDDENFQRKMRWTNEQESESSLIGSKFARYGLKLEDIEMLHDLQSSLRGHRNATGGQYKGPSEELDNAFKAISSANYMDEQAVREMDKRAIDEVFPRVPLSGFSPADQELVKRGRLDETVAYKRAMDTAESGYGSQLVGAQYVGDLWQAARRDSRVFSLLPTFEMTAPTAYLPVEADIPEMLYVAENTAANSSVYGTSKTGSNRVQVNAHKFIINQIWSGEMEEDSIIPFIPFLRMQATKSLAHYSDSLILNGDSTTAGTGNINNDDAAPAATKHFLSFDGLRHVGLVDNTANSRALGAAVTLDDLQGQRARMIDRTHLMDWGHPTIADDLVWIADPETADKIALLTEHRTLDKYGPNATVYNGQVESVLGSPIIGSIAMPLTEADGKPSSVTPANNVKGQILCFNRRAFVAGWRRRVRLEVDPLIGRDQTLMIWSLRVGLGRYSPTGAASGIEAADVLYNVTI